MIDGGSTTLERSLFRTTTLMPAPDDVEQAPRAAAGTRMDA
jgi:hypothetical protein